MKQPYLFELDSLGFRPVTGDDLEYLLMLDADPEVMSFFPGGAQTHQDIKNKINRYISHYNESGYGIFLIFDANSDEFIGRAGFGNVETGEIEVGYLVIKKYWRKGYGTRILKALLLWAKKNIIRYKIIAFTPLDHIASERVMQKAGMIFLRQCMMKGVECVIYEYRL